jgi:hypothetical protein
MPSDDFDIPTIDVGSLVVVHCANPREKHWGLLIRMDGLGVVLRGLDLESVEDWLAQERGGGEPLIAPSTFFLPTHRVIRLDLDDSGPVVVGYGDRFNRECDRDVRRALIGDDSPEKAN